MSCPLWRLCWKNLVHHGSTEGKLRQYIFGMFCDGRTASQEPISHTVCGTEGPYSLWYRDLTLQFWETNHRTQKLWTDNFVKSPDPLLSKIISWHLLLSLMNVCISCFKVPGPLPHYAVSQESFNVHITHSLNVSCIAPLCMKSNYSTQFTFGGDYCFRHVDMVMQAQNCQVRHDMDDWHTLHNTSTQSIIWFAVWF